MKSLQLEMVNCCKGIPVENLNDFLENGPYYQEYSYFKTGLPPSLTASIDTTRFLPSLRISTAVPLLSTSR